MERKRERGKEREREREGKKEGGGYSLLPPCASWPHLV